MARGRAIGSRIGSGGGGGGGRGGGNGGGGNAAGSGKGEASEAPAAHVACLGLYLEHTSEAYRLSVPTLTSEERAQVSTLYAGRLSELLSAFPLQAAEAISAAAAAATAAAAAAAAGSADDPNASAEVRWAKLRERKKGTADARLFECPAMQTLMAMRGCEAVKALAVELCCRVAAEKHLSAAQRLVTSLNFSFLGNPGTGKSTAARAFGQLLFELSLRKKATFTQTTGEAMEREGGDKAAKYRYGQSSP